MSQNKFLVVGTGRSGTTYCQAILRICGLNVTHQKHVTFHAQEELPDEVDGEASFMAVPYLEQYRDYTIVLVTRPIEDVVRSWQKRGCLVGGWEKFYPDFAKHLGELAEGADVVGAMQMWEESARNYCDFELRIETISNKPHLLFEAVGRPEVFDEHLVGAVRKDVNSDR